MVSRYVPILKASEGEFRALGALDSRGTSRTFPVLEVQPVPTPRATRLNPNPTPRTVEHHLDILLRHLHREWPHLAALDTAPLGPTIRMADGSHPLTYLLSSARAQGRLLIATVRLASDAELLAAAASGVATDRRGVCLRLVGDDFDNPTRLTRRVDRTLARVGASPHETDLVVDLGGISAATTVGVHAATAEQFVRMVPYVPDWRSLAVVATSFPDSISNISLARLPRKEWHAWRLLRSRGLPRIPDFGDYGITGAATVAAQWRGNPNIRYTADTVFVVVRVMGTTGPQSSAALARLIIAMPEFRGIGFSRGDDLIAECAANTWGPGSATNWRMIGTNHHITLVTR